jgi:20S proteasome alpha/beta subunit
MPMTLIAAFRCSNGGIMLCADREENDGFSRREVDKIYRINMLPCQVFIAGAGQSGIVSTAHSTIHGALIQAFSEGRNVLNEHKSIIESALRSVHERYPENLGNGLELIVIFASLTQGNVPILYRTELSMMVPESFYCAYGSGKGMADYFADRLYEYGRLDKDSIKVLAAFILREAEHVVASVGLGADIWIINDGETAIHMLSKGVVKEIQDCIPRLEESLWSHWKDNVKLPLHLRE